MAVDIDLSAATPPEINRWVHNVIWFREYVMDLTKRADEAKKLEKAAKVKASGLKLLTPGQK